MRLQVQFVKIEFELARKQEKTPQNIKRYLLSRTRNFCGHNRKILKFRNFDAQLP